MDPVSRAQQEITPQSRRTLRGGHDPRIGTKTQFRPGESGNPGGKRKKAEITKIFEEIFRSKTDRDEIKDSIALTLKSSRMAGVLLLREAAERLEGKVLQQVELEGTVTLALAETVSERRKRLGNGNNES